MKFHEKIRFFLIFLGLNLTCTHCHHFSECPVLEDSKGRPFQKTDDHSKYVYDPLADFVPFQQAEEICNGLKMEMAEITSYADYYHLVSFIKEHRLNGRNWALGLTDSAKEGFFIQRNGFPIKFQTFWISQPDNYGNESDCVELSETNTGEFAMFDVPCTNPVFPLCQFKEGEACNHDSPQTAAARLLSDNVTFIGSTVNRDYYISNIQKTWLEGAKFCGSHHQQLLDFNDEYEMDMVTMITRDFIQREGLHKGTSFWTSGYFIDETDMEPTGYHIIWAGNEKLFGTLNISRNSWDWTPNEPRDTSGVGIENCVTMSPFSPETASWSPETSHIPYLTASNCFVPYPVICYQDANNNIGVRRKGDNGEGTTPRPTTICPEVTPPKLNLSKPGLDNDEIIELMMFNSKERLHTNGANINLNVDAEWRKPIVQAIVKIVMKMCPKDFVSHEFINLIKNMMLIYYNNIEHPKITDEWKWDEFINDLKGCVNRITPFEEVSAHPPYTFSGYTPPNSTNVIPVSPPQEKVDEHSEMIEIIIDAFWFMFNLSAGACINTITNMSKITWMSEYLYQFVQDFFDTFAHRWITTEDVNYGAFLGDVDLRTSMYNLRACSAAVYELNGIFNLYYSRPVEFPSHLISESLNFKTGEALGEIIINP